MKRVVFIFLLILILLFLLLNDYKTEAFANAISEDNKIMWDNKIILISQVIENLKKEWKEIGFDDFNLESKDFTIINSRKRLIELLPVTKMLPKLDYDKIKSFVKRFDPENYLVISKTITKVPKVLKPVNIIIVNNMLYQSTPYGVLKYEIPKLSELNQNSGLNASIEACILNDYNTFNMTSYPIYNLDGKLLQKQGVKILDLKTNEEYEFTNINNKIELLNKKSIDKIIKDEQEIKDSVKQADIANNKIKEIAKNEQNDTNKTIAKDTQLLQQISKEKVKENMVDIGGIVEIKVADVTQLKTLNPQTFLPIVKVEAEKQANIATKVTDEQVAKKAIDEAAKKALEEATKKAADATKLAATKPADEQALKNAADAVKKVAEAKTVADEAAKKVTAETKTNLVIKSSEIELNKILESLVSVIEYDGIIYTCHPNIIRPLSNWAQKINTIINKKKYIIKGIIPHYYFLNNKFNYVIIFIFNDDFCVVLNKEDVSEVMDINEVLGIKFNQIIPDRISCDDLQVILEQMTKSNVVTKDKSNSILKSYKCDTLNNN